MENVENVEEGKRGKSEPVEMPEGFVDYWFEKVLTHNKDYPMPCSYCDEPIEKGDRYFYLHAVNDEKPLRRLFLTDPDRYVAVSKLGHITHLIPKPEQEWAFDPAKQMPQPWEMDPSIPAPPGWEEWKRRNRGVNYG